MERIVGLALARYLAAYVKGDIKFHDWSLHDLEFKVDVIQDLIGMPPNIVIKRASCNKMWAKIPWYKLGHDPILLIAETIELELEEPLEMTPPKPQAPKPLAPVTKKQAPGFTERVMDNIKFQIGEVKIRLHTLGKISRRRKARPPVAVVRIRDIDILSTNAKWESADLQEVHKVNALGHVLLYRLIKIGRASVWLELEHNQKPQPESNPGTQTLQTETIGILNDVPVQVKVRTKKEYFGGPMMNVELEVELAEVVASLNRSHFKSCQRLLDAVLECLYRQIDSEASASGADPAKTKTAPNSLPGSAPRSRRQSRAIKKERASSKSKPGSIDAPVVPAVVAAEEKPSKTPAVKKEKRPKPAKPKDEKVEKPPATPSPAVVPQTPTKVETAAVPSTPAPNTAQKSGWFGRLSSWYYQTPTTPATAPAAPATAAPVIASPVVEESSESSVSEMSEASSSDEFEETVDDVDEETKPQPDQNSDEHDDAASFYSGSDAEDEEASEQEASEFHDVDDNFSDKGAEYDAEQLPEEPLPDEAGVPFNDEEDVAHTAYHLHILKGQFDIHDEEHSKDGKTPPKSRGLTRLTYEDFEVHLIPSILKLDEDGYVTMDGSNEPLSRAEIEVIVGDYTLSMLEPPSDRHPEFTSLLKYSPKENATDKSQDQEPMLHATFIHRPKRPRPGLSAEAKEKLGYFSSELQLVLSNVEVVFDADVWERLYCFFFSGTKGRKFERYVGSNLEYLVEAALEGYFNFRLTSTFARVILPPYAGHTGLPHVASQVLRLKVNDVTVCSAPSSIQTPDVFKKGIFIAGGNTFPSRHEDLSASMASGNAGPEPFASQKFEVSLEGLSGAVQATPAAPQRFVLQPMDVKLNVFLHEFLALPKHRPHLEMLVQCSRVVMSLTQTQYQYFFSVFGERIRWDPHKYDPPRLSKGAPSQPALTSPVMTPQITASTSATPSSVASPNSAESPWISHILVNLAGATVTLLDDDDDSSIPPPTFNCSSSSAEIPSIAAKPKPIRSLASLELEDIEFAKENLVKKTVAKISISSLIIRDPAGEQMQSPFAVLVAPLANSKVAVNTIVPMLLARYEAPWVDVPSGPSSEMWIQFRGAQVCWIYTILAKLQLFFTSTLPPSPNSFDAEHVRKLLDEQALSLGTEAFQSAAPSRMNWQMAMSDCEALVVESPASPECLPMTINHAKLTRVSPNPRRVIYHFLGDVKMFSVMWNSTQKQLTRTALTEPFTLDTIYAYARVDKEADDVSQKLVKWRTDFTLRIPELFVSVTHAQYIMLLSAMDSQMSDLRKKPLPASLEELLTYRFHTEIDRCSISFSQTGVPFARLDMKALHYITEDWTSKYKMFIGGDDVRLIDLAVSDSTQFKSIMHNRLGNPSSVSSNSLAPSPSPSPAAARRPRTLSANAPSPMAFLSAVPQLTSNDDFLSTSPVQSPYFNQIKKGKGKERERFNSFGSKSDEFAPIRMGAIDDVTSPSAPSRGISVPQMDAPMDKTGADKKRLLNVKHETSYLPPEEPLGQRISSQSHWIVELNPVEFVYSPEIIGKLQEFFSWMEEHQNLRKAYRNLRSRVAGYWSKDNRESIDSTAEAAEIAEQLKLLKSQRGDQRDMSTIFHLIVHNPVLLLPEKLNSTRTRILSCDLGGLELTHETMTKLLPPPSITSGPLLSPRVNDVYRDDSPIGSPRDQEPSLEGSGGLITVNTATTAVNVNSLQMKLALLQQKSEPDLLTGTSPAPSVATVISSARVLDPVSFSLFLNRKSSSITEVPFLHVEARMDQLVARVSIERFKTVLGIMQAYLVRSVGDAMKKAPGSKTESTASPASPRIRPDVAASPDPSLVAPATDNETNLIDVVVEFNCKRINLAVVSDYEEELDLFFAYFKDIDAHVDMFSDYTQASLMLRFESLINDLNFMTPEKFIDPVHLALNFRTEAEDPTSKARVKSFKDGGALPRQEVAIHIDEDSESDEVFYDADEAQEKMSIELVVLDQIHVEIKKDLIRQLIEIYNVAVAAGAKESDLSSSTSSITAIDQNKSHFQYILENSTEANIFYGQPGTLDKKMLAPGQKVPFSFANPYLPKLLEFVLEGWAKAPGEFSLDEPGRILLNFTHETIPEIERELMLVVKPGGLKRFVEFKALHRVRNLTDQPLELVTYWENQTWNKALRARSYIVPPSTSSTANTPTIFTPILARGRWGKDMLLAVRFNSDPLWQFSDQFALRRNEFVERLTLERSQISNLSSSSSAISSSSLEINEERTRSLFLSVSKDEDGMVTLTFSPPLLLVNLSVFPLDYNFAAPLRIEGQIAPLTSKSFYIETEKSNVYLKLDGFANASRPVSVNALTQSVVDNNLDQNKLSDDEKDSISLNIVTRPALLGDVARVMFVNTQFLFVNDTDLLLFVQQRGAGKNLRGRHRVTLAPRARVPFSWYPVGARQILVKVGDTQWSKGLNLSKPAITKLSVTIAELDLVYDLVMEVKQADAFSRIVIFRPCLHVTNRTKRDLVLELDSDEKKAPTPKSIKKSKSFLMKESNLEASALNTSLTVKKNSRGDSAICPAVVKIRVPVVDGDTEELKIGELPLTQAGLYTVKLESRSKAKFFAIDVEVIINTGGTFVTLRENKHPPFIFHNNTPFALKLRPKNPMRLTKRSNSQSDIVIVKSHATVSFFDERLPSAEEEETLREPLEFLVAVEADAEDAERDEDELIVPLEKDDGSLLDIGDFDAAAKKSKKNKGKEKDRDERDRRHRLLERHFSKYRRSWSTSFQGNTVGVQRVHFHVPQHLVPQTSDVDALNSSPKKKKPISGSHRAQEIPEAQLNALTLTVTQQGATKHLSFALPTEGDLSTAALPAVTSANSSETGTYLSFVLRVPRVEIALLNDRGLELLFSTLVGLDVELAQLRNSKKFVYLVLRDLQIDSMDMDAEHPVLFQTNWRKLTEFDSHHYVRPNLFELLYEWSAQETTTFVEYFGVRALPTSVKLDGHVIEELMNFAELFSASGGAAEPSKIELREEDVELQQHRVLAQYASVAALSSSTSSSSLEDETDEATASQLSLGRVDVFPLEVGISVGRNSLFWPVITEALVQLRSFQRAHVSGSSASLLRSLYEDYIGQAWGELYKVIIDLDVIASPVQNSRKMARGLREFILFPIESLVFDDTPGAFLFGLMRGLKSLFLNSSDVFMTLFMKFSGTIAWLIQQATLDPEYQEISAQRARRHPRGIWEGFVQAFLELGRGFYHGVTGLGLLPYRGARDGGLFGFVKGLGRGIIGLPLKPLAGFFEFQRIFYDGALHALGRGTHLDQRWHTVQSRDFAARHSELFQQWLPNANDTKISATVRLYSKDNRVKERYLVFSRDSARLLVFNTRKLAETAYVPRVIPLSKIFKVLRPVIPETTFVVVHKSSSELEHLQFVAPDRELFIQALSAERVLVEDVDKNQSWRK